MQQLASWKFRAGWEEVRRKQGTSVDEGAAVEKIWTQTLKMVGSMCRQIVGCAEMDRTCGEDTVSISQGTHIPRHTSLPGDGLDLVTAALPPDGWFAVLWARSSQSL